MTTPTFETISIDLDEKTIRGLIEWYAYKRLKPESLGFIQEVIDDPDSNIFEALGRAYFNDIVVDIITEEVKAKEMEK